MRAEDVPVGGDGGEPGRDHLPRRRAVCDQHHVPQQRPYRHCDRPVAGDRVRRPPRPRHIRQHSVRVVPDVPGHRGPHAPGAGHIGQPLRMCRVPEVPGDRGPRTWHVRQPLRAGSIADRGGSRPVLTACEPEVAVVARREGGGGCGHDERGAACVACAEGGEGLDGRVEIGHREAVGQLAQRRADRGAGLGLHRHQRRHGAQHAFGPGDRPGSVAARQPDRQRLHPGTPVGALLFGLPLLRHQLGDPGARGLVRRPRVRAALLQRRVALGEGAELLAATRELGLRGRGALLGLGQRVGEPFDLLRGGRGPAAQRFGPPGQRREARAPIGQRADGGQVRPFGRRQGALVPRTRLGDLREGPPGGLDRLDQHLLLLGDGLGLGVELVGIPAGGTRLRRPREVSRPLLREPDGAREPLGERREPVPGVLGGGQARRVLGERRLQPLLLDARDRELLLDLGPPRPRAGLVGLLLGQLAAEGDDVVRGQPQPGVAQLGLHRLRPPRDLRLPPQRLELAAQLAGEVGQPGEVGLHRVELAQRLLFALAVLEDPGRLLDVGAAVFRLGRQHGIELALPDDHVHLAADAGVGQQLLDVEQAAVVAVDLVLARAVAEHPTGDRHLGVVDGQGAVGVVDREGHLGAAEGRPARRAREDDVFHLAAAQRLRALFAQHPADGVDDVGLPRAVRSDDAGDARFEAQRRRRGEGLEALQRQALEVHRVRPPGIEVPRAYRPPRPSKGKRCGRSGLHEAPEAAAGGVPALDDAVDPARRARAAQGVEQALTRPTITLRNHRDPAVREVARLAHQAELQSPAPRPPAKTHALDVAVDPSRQSGRRFFHAVP